MKNFVSTTTVFIILSALILASIAAENRQELGKITFPLGEVAISRDRGGLWQQALLNCVVYNTDIMKTGAESRCEISLKDGSVIRIGENTELAFDDIELKDNRLQGSARISAGQIWSNLQKLKSGDEALSVRTPTAVMAVRGTVFRANAEPDSSASVLVYEGQVDVKLTEEMEEKVLPEKKDRSGAPRRIEGPQQVHGPYEVTLEEWQRIVAGMQINIRKDGKYYSFNFDPEADAALDWVKWNKERDSLIQR